MISESRVAEIFKRLVTDLRVPAKGFRLGSIRVHEILAGILEATGKLRVYYGTAAQRAASTDYYEGVVWWESDSHDLYVGTGAAWQVIGGAGGAPPGAHVLATTAGLGGSHTTSGLTAGQVLRATAAAAAAFQAIQDADVPASHSGSAHHNPVTIGADGEHSLATQVLSGVDAAALQKGHIQLAGDLEGSAAAPTVKAASLTVAGKVEIATAAETTTGTDAGRAVSPDGLAGSDYGKRIMYIKEVIAPATALTIGDAKTTVVVPIEITGWNLVRAEARVYTVGTGATLVTIQVRNVTQAADMLSTPITIDASELTSYTAATPSVVDAANDDVATADILAVDIDAINNTVVALGLDVILTWQMP